MTPSSQDMEPATFPERFTLYDIHGNLPALETVLSELEREAPDVIVIGGDVAWDVDGEQARSLAL